MKKEHILFLKSKFNEAQKKNNTVQLTKEQKQKIWKEFESKFGKDIKIDMMTIPLGLLPNLFLPV